MAVRDLEAMAERTGQFAQLGSRLNIIVDQGRHGSGIERGGIRLIVFEYDWTVYT